MKIYNIKVVKMEKYFFLKICEIRRTELIGAGELGQLNEVLQSSFSKFYTFLIFETLPS